MNHNLQQNLLRTEKRNKPFFFHFKKKKIIQSETGNKSEMNKNKKIRKKTKEV